MASSKKKTSLKIELDGQVSLVEFKGKKRIATHPLDSKFVIELLKKGLVKEAKT